MAIWDWQKPYKMALILNFLPPNGGKLEKLSVEVTS
jgi:hypothetical protein